MFGITAGTSTQVEQFARALVTATNAFNVGLTFSLVELSTRDDPTGAFQSSHDDRHELENVVTKTVSVDEWLHAQETTDVLFALAPVADRDDLVRVTPWLRAAGLLTALALELPRTTIAAVRGATEGIGALLNLAHLEFQPGSTIALDELYRQIGERTLAIQSGLGVILDVALFGDGKAGLHIQMQSGSIGTQRRPTQQ